MAAACLLTIVPFFWWGSPSGHDFEFHMFSWMEVLSQWKHGVVYPRWAELAHFGYGEARFLFYPPASWTLGAALGASLPWKMVPGAYCWIVLMLAGTAMYRLAREWLPAEDALFAAGFYALNPYHLLIVYWRSAYAELLAASLLPLLVLCVLKLQEPAPDHASHERRFRPTLCLSLVLAAGWLTNAPAAVMVHYSTAGLALLLAALEASRGRKNGEAWSPRVWRPLIRTGFAILLGAGLASFYLLPAFYEQRWIEISQVLAPGVRPQDNFLFTPTADPDHNRFNLLISSVALAEIGVLTFAIWFSRRSRAIHAAPASPSTSSRLARGGSVVHSAAQMGTPWMLLSVWGTGTALFLLSVSNLLWRYLPKFRFVQLPFRWLLCLNAALAILLTMAARRWRSRLLACAILLAVVVIAGYRIQSPWWDTSADIQEMSDAVADKTGYEGTDEYVPRGADAYELNKNLPLVSSDAGTSVRTNVFTWGPTEKHFAMHAAVSQNLTLHLFGYPAWEVVVNGRPTATQKTELTGIIVFPVAAGDNDVHIYFRRTVDRLSGNILSLISLGFFVVIWIQPAWVDRVLTSTRLSTAQGERPKARAENAEIHVA